MRFRKVVFFNTYIHTSLHQHVSTHMLAGADFVREFPGKNRKEIGDFQPKLVHVTNS